MNQRRTTLTLQPGALIHTESDATRMYEGATLRPRGVLDLETFTITVVILHDNHNHAAAVTLARAELWKQYAKLHGIRDRMSSAIMKMREALECS